MEAPFRTASGNRPRVCDVTVVQACRDKLFRAWKNEAPPLGRGPGFRPEATMSSCSNCQASLPPGGAFCAECGAAVPVGSGGSSGSPTPTPGTLPPPVNPAPPSAAGSRQQSSRGTPTAPSSPQGQVREPSTDGVPLPPPMLSGVPLPPPPLAGATPPSAPPQTQPPSAMPVPPPSNAAVPVSQPPRQGPSVARCL